MIAGHHAGRCQKSCQDADAYPFTLIRTAISKRTLGVYRQTLRGCPASPYGVLKLFDPKLNVIFTWDYHDYDFLPGWTALKLESIDEVKEAMSSAKTEPLYRFIFVHQRNSRSPLGCSRGQLEHVLTHYQIMAPFMDHIFTFHSRPDPYLQASFRSEDYIRGGHSRPWTKDDSRIQHCFNLVGLECDYDTRSQNRAYLYRQTAAYFSLELVSGQAVWLIIKGDKAVRENLEDHTRQLNPDTRLEPPARGFILALQSHLLIYEWAIQTWTPYINHLQSQYSDMSKDVAYTRVVHKTENEVIDQNMLRNLTLHSMALQNNRSQGPHEEDWNPLMGWLRGLSGSSFEPSVLSKKPGTFEPDMDNIFSFGKLQGVHQEATEVQVGLSVLDQNRTVLQEMRKRFEQLQRSDAFLHHLRIDQEEFQNFFHKTEHCISELENQHKRLSAIQADLKSIISLFHGILQHYNTHMADSYARSARTSSDSVSRLASKTKQDTVSIHVITVLTLFFFPATFVATFFGSGVINFERQGGSESRSNSGRWGYWEVRWGALMLFGSCIGPLMGVVLATWAVTYIRSWRRWRATTGQGGILRNEVQV